jgi:hypothetical protein
MGISFQQVTGAHSAENRLITVTALPDPRHKPDGTAVATGYEFLYSKNQCSVPIFEQSFQLRRRVKALLS